ncbi:SDR family NAD(P)-dependent oxidoreductase [Pedobacter sp. 22226]|uniref:SDR family NAD(P)-dependent oxidoreductase n=1 Tax=Pedobacter sp. 22226 TaxID=3453894 RepID=UPI003F84A290
MAYAVRGDVNNLSGPEKLYARTKSKSGGIDTVFINVGQGKLAPIAETSEGLFDELTSVKLKGAFQSFFFGVPCPI